MRERIRDGHVYLVTEPRLARGRSHEEIAGLALAGGVDVFQLRDKDAADEEFLAVAERLRALTREAGIPFVVNDRVDLALACGADGVHVGQDDQPAREVRRRIGDAMLLGVSVRTLDELHRAVDDGADYLGIGPVFDARTTKSDAAPPIGLEGVARLRAASDLPLVAIGGIGPSNARSVIEAGADGLAVISCIVGADDVTAAVRDLRQRVLAAKAGR